MAGNLGRVHFLFRKFGLLLDPAVENREHAMACFQQACGWLDAANLIARAGGRMTVNSRTLHWRPELSSAGMISSKPRWISSLKGI
ncbi:uncharacterized protein Dvar_63920 [Desulfosarcina variabilis str. Montpellier]|uniref:hypothetical protein n=1 Tax=Desulfosarcina variabilis TaxID=2300 RepID=UPI003AFB4B4A